MPLTFPSHAAAVLPLVRARSPLPPLALVVGSASPDLWYLYGAYGRPAHSVPGLFTLCLPAGLLALVWLQVLVLPLLERVTPRLAGVEWARFLTWRVAPPATLRAAGWTLAALLLGAATHVLWDGFTHRHQWPARELYRDVFVPVLGRQLPLARVLQHASTLVGAGLFAAFMARVYPALPARPGPASARPFWSLAAVCAVGMAVGVAVRLQGRWHLGSLEQTAWALFWPAAAGLGVALTLAGAMAWWRERRVGVGATSG